MIGIIYRSEFGIYRFYCKSCVRRFFSFFVKDKDYNARVWTVSDGFAALNLTCSNCNPRSGNMWDDRKNKLFPNGDPEERLPTTWWLTKEE